ncbi:T9SS type A sorting domain-containing protein [Hymenobacter sp. ASUV-10]|uniref:T9SS type A sorting domain-containing protein n=1 Tax=Hymenobacter aranciens TaxID=3063996 RepID=A0ABT9BHA5_9BACT|nr:T9SS type A sorting domain-containing protein [Hymenobacter sp. ASUV-10]MDO7877043.1 T9SS type A sorting domain-containing protein [Hymenobacter sp. ASUV-10]
MTNSYNRAGLTTPRLRNLALLALLAGGTGAAYGQALPYTAPNVTNRAGTYTDLGTTGTVITTANFDDANSAAQSFGFNFVYNGATYTDFVLNTNGFIKLGTAAPVAPFFSSFAQDVATGGPLNSAETNVILPFNTDLEAGSSTPEYRMSVSGTAPGRVLTIQWKNVSDKARPAASGAANIDKQYANFSFQVKLYETTSQIDFVYGTATPATTTVNNANFVTVGIKGSGTATNQAITAIKPSNVPWNQTTFQQGPYLAESNGVNIRRAPILTGGQVVPDPGRTFSFNIPVPTDAATSIVYGYNKLVVTAGQPATIQARIRNAGTSALNNVTATLTVSGANTFTAAPQVVGSLAVGATAVVVFTGVEVPNQGNNTVTVTTSIAGDGNPTNDAASMIMVTDPTTTSFITPNEPSLSSFGGAPTITRYFAAKINFVTPRDITAVNAYIGDADPNPPTNSQRSTVGETLYGVVLDATTGALLGRSANFVVTAADVETVHTFQMTAPVSAPVGDVLIGMVHVTSTNPSTASVFPMGVQSENPNRPDTFYGGQIVNGVPSTPQIALNTTTAPNPTNVYKYMLEAVTTSPATCPTPNSITSTATPNSATFTFNGPANASGYELVYGPTGFNPATAGTTSPAFTTSPYTLTGLTGATCYDVYMRTICGATDRSALAGPIAVCTPCTPPIITTYPYTQDFNTITVGQSLPCGITVADVNNDDNTWEPRATVPTQGNPNLPIGNGGTGNAMVYFFNEDGVTGANDWFFSPAMLMTAGRAYRVGFSLRSAGGTTYLEGLEVKYGAAATPAGQTTTIYTNTAISNPAYAAATGVTDITPATTGTYYIGFHATSAADKFFLAVDDLTVTQVLSSSAALTRALTVYPNPSASGQFNLEVRGANATQGLNVEVTNMLGQTVYTGKAKDNFTNSLNLTSLASGIYTLKVKNGNEYSVQQISIVK